MDPVACLYELLDSLAANDREESLQYLSDLTDWIKKGGFLPVITVEDAHARMICKHTASEESDWISE